MYSALNTFSFPNSELNFHSKDLGSIKQNFLQRPMSEFHDHCTVIPSSDKGDHQVRQEQKREEKCGDGELVLSSCLGIKLPCSGEFKVEEENDGFRTPTSSDHRIPAICPPAPRKPKSIPATKRKGSRRRSALLDLSNEVESLFPPAVQADLGGKIKKARREN